MKSGQKTFFKIRCSMRPERRVHALRNGDLRSLMRYLDKPEFSGDSKTEQILGLAIIEAAKRWLHKGEGKNL